MAIFVTWRRRAKDLVRSLRRTQQVTVKDTSDGLSALWAIAAAGGVLDGERGCRPVILASEKYLLSEARRQFLGGVVSNGRFPTEEPMTCDMTLFSSAA